MMLRAPAPVGDPAAVLTSLDQARRLDLPVELRAAGEPDMVFVVNRPDELRNAFVRCWAASTARPRAVEVRPRP